MNALITGYNMWTQSFSMLNLLDSASMATESPKSVEDMSLHELNTWLLEKGLDEEYCTLLTKGRKHYS